MSVNGADPVNTVKDTIYKACLYLDDQKWSDWLELCDEEQVATGAILRLSPF